MSDPYKLTGPAADQAFAMGNPFAAQQQQIARKRQIAQALMQQSLQPNMPQQTGTHASQMNPLQPLAQVLQGYLGNRAMGKADEAQTALAGQARAAEMADFAPLQQAQSPEELKAAISRAMMSQFPTVRAYASKMDEGLRKQLELGIGAVKDVDPRAALTMAQRGSLDGVSVAPPVAPQWGTTPDGRPTVINTGKGGVQTGSYAPAGISISNQLGGKTDLELDKSGIGQLEKSKEMLAGARSTVASTVRAVELLNKGADAGGGASPRQALRQLGAAFGVQIPITGLTAELRSQLGEKLLANIRALAPVTANDVVVMERLLGSIDTDPNALRELSAMLLAKTMITVDNHNALVEKSAGVSSGDRRKYDIYKFDLGAFDAKDPALLTRAYQLMKESGHDMSKYTFDGKPVSEIDLNVDFYRGSTRPTAPPPGRLKVVP